MNLFSRSAVLLFSGLLLWSCAQSRPPSSAIQTQKVRRAQNEASRYIVQMEVLRGQYADFMIIPASARTPLTRRVSCGSNGCVLSCLLEGQAVMVAVEYGRSPIIPVITHDHYEVRVYECAQTFTEVGRDVVTCNFSF